MVLELPPAVLFDDVLDTYFSRMDAIVRQNDGDIDSITGESLLAIFARPEQAADAAGAVIQMRESEAELLAYWRAHLGVSIGSLDVGIAPGHAAIGQLNMSHCA